jgi:two-component system sensor histidine kinase UhpB
MPEPTSPTGQNFRFWSPPVALAGTYLLFSIAWILVTDYLAIQIAQRLPDYNDLQRFKGLLFVSISSLIIFMVTRRFYRSLRQRFRENKALLARYDLVHRATREAIVDHAFGSGCAIVNDTMMRLMERDKPEVPGFLDAFLSQVHSSDRERVRWQLEHFSTEGGNEWVSRFKFRAENDGYRDMRAQGIVLRNSKTGLPERMIFSMSDETEVIDARAKLLYQQMQSRQEQSRSVIAAEERERERWAHELHDNVCQLLTAAGLLLAQTDSPDPVQERARELVKRSLDEIRQLSAAIRPPEFAEETLQEAIITLLANIQRIVPIEVTLQLEASVEARLSPEHKLMIYRIVQEQLNNILKYAAASSVEISVELAGDAVQLSIVDDGKGFEPEAVSSGIGLRNIRSRLQVFSGSLELRSAPGAGCALQASFPLPA